MANVVIELTEEQKGRIRDVFQEAGFALPGIVNACGTAGEFTQFAINAKKPAIESFEARKIETLKAITERRDLPSYAHYGNASGSIYILHRLNDRWVYSDVDFYEVIEAVARRIVMKGCQK